MEVSFPLASNNEIMDDPALLLSVEITGVRSVSRSRGSRVEYYRSRSSIIGQEYKSRVKVANRQQKGENQQISSEATESKYFNTI